MFELATQASFKFSVKEMVTKRRKKVKSGYLSFGYFSLLATLALRAAGKADVQNLKVLWQRKEK
ncbi:MAG: hypothetical protein SOX56_02035 [[Pasteurella] mairii]|nr:hypothetical protein [[Pasteurella] mairii]